MKKLTVRIMILGAVVAMISSILFIFAGCKTVDLPDVNLPTLLPILNPTTTTTIPPTAGVPIKITHGASCHVPMQDKNNRERGSEQIRQMGPFSDFRTFEVGDDAFLDGFIMGAVRIENNSLIGNDIEHSGVVYVFDHWSVKTSSNRTETNPLPLDGVDKGCFRAWWKACEK